MSEPGYKHVLFKDLENYLKITGYLSGYTPFEQALIRKNIGAVSLNDIKSGGENLEYFQVEELIKKKKLVPGMTYAITNFRTIYKSHETKDGIPVTYGLDKHQSDLYTIVTMAVSEDILSPSVVVISDDSDSVYWQVLYSPTSEVLPDGQKTMGKILYMQDENLNKATYDFKNIVWENGYSFQKNGIENSKQCFCNDLCFTENVSINTDVSNMVSRVSDISIQTCDIDLSTPYQKQIIKLDDNVFIDYLDLETLTHQFYGVANNSRILV